MRVLHRFCAEARPIAGGVLVFAGMSLLRAVETGSHEQDYMQPKITEIRQGLKTDTYHGFNEFVRSPDPAPPALPGLPKKYAQLGWNGTLEEYADGVPPPDWIYAWFTAAGRTVFSGSLTWNGPDYENALLIESFLNEGSTNAGNGENGDYTVTGNGLGACWEIHDMRNVVKVSIGSPGVNLPQNDPQVTEPTTTTREFRGAMAFDWTNLILPCNTISFHQGSSHFPNRGPVTETLSQEVTTPVSLLQPGEAWRVRGLNEMVKATVKWRYQNFESWTAASQVPLLVEDKETEFRAIFANPECGIGDKPEVVLVVSTQSGGGAFVKYALLLTAKVEKQGEEELVVRGLVRARPIKPVADKMLAGIQMGEYEEDESKIDYTQEVRLETVLLRPGHGDCGTDCTRNRLGSIDWSMTLGKQPTGDSAGNLHLRAEAFSAQVYSPAGLIVSRPGQAGTHLGYVRRADGSYRQIHTGSRIFDLITPLEDPGLPAASYEIRTYVQAGSSISAENPALLVPTGGPLERTRLSDPDGNGNRLLVERFTTGTQPASTVEYAYASATNTWSMTEEGMRRTDRTTVTLSATDNQVTTSIWNLTGATPLMESKVQEKIRAFVTGGITQQMVIERVLDPDGAALVSQWDYAVGPDNQLFLREHRSHTGSWVRHSNGVFFTAGLPSRHTSVTTPFENDDPSGPRERVINEFPKGGGIERVDSLTGLKTFTGYGGLVQRGGRYYNQTRRYRARTGSVNPAGPDTPRETFQTYADGTFAGETAYHLDFSGVLEITTFALDPGTLRLTRTVERGAPNAAADAVVDGTRTTTVTDRDGELVTQTAEDIASGLTIDRQDVMDRDDEGRPTVIALFDGTLEERSYSQCCGLLEGVTRHGLTTTYEYDSLRRRISESRAGLTTKYDYDALDRVVKVTRVGSDNSEIVLSTTAYDLAGRVIATTDARGGATTYAETYAADGSTTRTATAPDGSTVVDVTNRDGSPRSRSGTATAPAFWTYSLDTYASLPVVVTRGHRAQPGTEATEWTKTYTDSLGHVLAQRTADDFLQTYGYNAKDQLVRQVDPDGVTTLFAYNARGEQEIQALDMNRNGAIDPDGADRITRTIRDVTSAHGTTVHRSTTSVWAANGSDASEAISVNETSADGLQAWSTVHGLTTHSQTVHAAGGTRTVTTTGPDGTVAVHTFVNERLTVSTTSHPSLGALGSVTSQYDAHGRVETSTDARTGPTSYTYYDDDQVHTVTTPDPDTTRTGDGYDPQVTTVVYDDMGRVSQVTQPDGGVVHTTYWPTGSVKRTWGSRTYPSEYTYDEQERVKTLTTWQDYAGDAGKAVTTWNYDPKRGWLVRKSDATGMGAKYSYTPAGRLATRTWARELLRPTVYGYNPAGDLVSVIHSDATPAVALSYDRLGRLLSRTDAAGTCTYAYEGLTSQITDETYTGGLLNGLSVNRGFDSLLRLGSLSANSESSVLNQIGYAYDAASRLSTVTAGANTATYGYLANSPLVESVTFQQGGATRLMTNKSYDALNRLSSITSTPSSTSTLSFNYLYNSANQRTRVTREDGSRWDYGYDALGQVISAKKSLSTGVPVLGHDFGYAFDDIGNRKTATSNASTSAYNVSLLNQYDARTVPGAVELLGTADPAATVTANGVAVSRQDSLFYDQLPVDNAGGPRYETLMVQGTNAGVTVNEQRGAFVPQTPETFVHDADGNLTDDARWRYTWDAENRLVEMQTADSAVAVGMPNRRLVFTYDSLGRRIAKRVMGWDATAQAWGVQSSKLFLYDGWNLLAELDAMNTNAPVRTYMWGLDLSGSLQGAGGVGGLLFTNSHLPIPNSAAYAASFDGNGNVIAYVDMATGATSATYEYSAFGETLVAEGPAQETMPFRFSTKFTDNETALLYYGLRFYDPHRGRWLSRDPIEERGGPNLYNFVNNSPLGLIDLFGLYPGVPGHGAAVSPEDSVNRISGMVERSKRALAQRERLAPDAEWIDPLLNQFNYIIPILLPSNGQSGINTDAGNLFVYTCKYGWVDLGHFFRNAHTTAMYGIEAAEEGSTLVERGQYYIGSIFGSKSGYAVEDLVSNQAGREFGRSLDQQSDISTQWERFLKQAGAVRWDDASKKAIDNDLADYLRLRRMPRAKSVEEGLAWQKNRPLWKCLCDGDKPKLDSHRY